MVMSTGIAPMGVYTAAINTNQLFDALLAILPNVDAAPAGRVTSISLNTSGVVQGIQGFLDELSPIAVAQLRVELTAMRLEAGNVAI